MNFLQSGWKTSEGWLAFASMIFMVLKGLGVLSPADATQLEGMTDRVVTDAFSLIASAVIMLTYIAARWHLKLRLIGHEEDIIQETPATLRAFPFVIATVLCLWAAGGVEAQSVASAVNKPLPKKDTCFNGGSRPQQQQSDPALMAVLNQILAQQQQNSAMLQSLLAKPSAPPVQAPAPTPAPGGSPITQQYHYYLPGPGSGATPPLLIAQPGPQPQIIIPQPGPQPQIVIPQPGPQPQIVIPQPGPPQIVVPQPNPTPPLVIPQPGGTPPPVIPQPGNPKVTPMSPPAGFQTYTAQPTAVVHTLASPVK